MANSSTNLDLISSSQAQKEVTANALSDATSMAATYGRRASTTAALTWGYYGGNVTKADGSMAQISNGTVSLTASAMNYLVAQKSTGTVSVSTSTTNWNDRRGYWRLYQISTGASAVTSYTDYREPAMFAGGSAAAGYSTGAGGTVTQATSKSTGVTLNKRTGQITMHNAALAAGAIVGFTLTNSEIAATDVIGVSIASGATADSYALQVDAVAAGSCRIHLHNKSAGSLSEAVVINFVVINGASA